MNKDFPGMKFLGAQSGFLENEFQYQSDKYTTCLKHGFPFEFIFKNTEKPVCAFCLKEEEKNQKDSLNVIDIGEFYQKSIAEIYNLILIYDKVRKSYTEQLRKLEQTDLEEVYNAKIQGINKVWEQIQKDMYENYNAFTSKLITGIEENYKEKKEIYEEIQSEKAILEKKIFQMENLSKSNDPLKCIALMKEFLLESKAQLDRS